MILSYSFNKNFYYYLLILFNWLTFNIFLDATMPINFCLPPPSSVGGGGLVCVLGPDCQLFS